MTQSARTSTCKYHGGIPRLRGTRYSAAAPTFKLQSELRAEADSCESRGMWGRSWPFDRRRCHCRRVGGLSVHHSPSARLRQDSNCWKPSMKVAPAKTNRASIQRSITMQSNRFIRRKGCYTYFPINFPTYSATAKIFSSCSLLPTSCKLTCAPS